MRWTLRAAGSIVLAACGCAHHEPPIVPVAPPPRSAPIPWTEATTTSATAPAPTASTSATTKDGPLPPLPSQAPRYAEATPPEATWTRAYPSGQWVYLEGEGWIAVPNDSFALEVEGVPYAYLYTASAGWTWYVSPWGWGPYRYGGWVLHPWRPREWRGVWIAHPHVVERLGRPRRH